MEGFLENNQYSDDDGMEFFIVDYEMESDNDEGESDGSSEEEAEEVNEEDIEGENRPDLNHVDNEPADVPSIPSLMSLPDILLENIVHYSTKNAYEVTLLEGVSKRIRRVVTRDEFWARHPSFKDKALTTGKIIGRMDSETEESESDDEDQDGEESESDDEDEDILPSNRRRSNRHWTPQPTIDKKERYTRKLAFEKGLSYFQMNSSNAIIDVLGDGSECVADTLRTLLADILSRMNNAGPEAHFRLRGDTLGYLCELLQGFMIRRLEIAVSLNGHSIQVEREDIVLAFQQFHPFSPFSSQKPMRCNVGMNEHEQVASILCSCSLPSSSGTIWRWPSDDCHGVLQPESACKIIKRMADEAGILEMSNEAYILAEAELLHAMGMLLVEAYESSVEIEMTRKTSFLSADEELTYNEPTDSVDLFKIPPPSFDYSNYWNPGRQCTTIVPGQIRFAAEKRYITPYIVYGNVWIASAGFTSEEEMEIEKSYYFERKRMNLSDNSDNESEDEEPEELDIDVAVNDSDVSWSDNNSESDSETSLSESEEESEEDDEDEGSDAHGMDWDDLREAQE